MKKFNKFFFLKKRKKKLKYSLYNIFKYKIFFLKKKNFIKKSLNMISIRKLYKKIFFKSKFLVKNYFFSFLKLNIIKKKKYIFLKYKYKYKIKRKNIKKIKFKKFYFNIINYYFYKNYFGKGLDLRQRHFFFFSFFYKKKIKFKKNKKRFFYFKPIKNFYKKKRIINFNFYRFNKIKIKKYYKKAFKYNFLKNKIIFNNLNIL
jgi:hypothetical protein